MCPDCDNFEQWNPGELVFFPGILYTIPERQPSEASPFAEVTWSGPTVHDVAGNLPPGEIRRCAEVFAANLDRISALAESTALSASLGIHYEQSYLGNARLRTTRAVAIR